MPIPADDLSRSLTVSNPRDDASLPHIGIVGDTYTVTVAGSDTAGHYCVIDMLVPPQGGPGPHRHDFEETFILLEGELAFTFRGVSQTARAGETVHVPANAPHMFHNASAQPARLLCICSPAGQEDFFREIGVALPTRTSVPPKLDEAAQKAFMAKAKELAPRYRTELLEHA